MKKRFILALCHFDSSGVIHSFGPFESEAEAAAWQEAVGDVVNYCGMAGRLDVVPCFEIAPEA